MKRKLPPWLALLALFVFASAASAAEESLPELVRRVKPSVVSVITYNAAGEVALTGSGFFIRPGQVLTNLHVVEGAHHAEIRTFEGKGKTYKVAGLVEVDEDGDLAVLSVDMPAGRASVVETTSVIPDEGERIFVIGNPLRLEGSVADGIVSAVREVPSLGSIVQITAPISHGNSGSPVFNMRGQVVGVVTIRVMNGENINLALGVSRVATLRAGNHLFGFNELAEKLKASQRPDSISDWYYRTGLNSLWLGNYDSALGYFETAVNKNPARVEAWIQVGFCKVKQGKNQDAIRAFEQALRLKPASYEALSKLGDAYYFAGNYYKALEFYKQAVALRPDLAEGYYNLGSVYLEMGDRAAATAQSNLLKPLDDALYKKLRQEIDR
ncbi:MAG TPA: tetratricopeptide repeat-containing serine protease family protein [Pyrinomonadaceae bacterium]|jgi:tetratricopeptide (TPR) repeat protein|nr:tetratricopeptide repeat-containing serine protease family protein [Pyrinomonadaceae bacterium]